MSYAALYSMMLIAHSIAHTEETMQENNLKALIKTAHVEVITFLGYIKFIDNYLTLALKEFK